MQLINRITSEVCATYYPKCDKCGVKTYCIGLTYDSENETSKLLEILDREALKVYNRNKGLTK
jgi:hypothetical protein